MGLYFWGVDSSTSKKDKSMNKVLKNTIAAFINEIITFIVGIIIPKLIISFYGSEINGLVNSITQFLGFISLCELGIGAVIKANLYKPLAKKDTYELSAVLKSAQKFFRKIAYILVVYVGILVIIYPRVVNSSFNNLFTASLILIISISTFAQYYFGIIYQLLLNANEQAYIQLYTNCSTLSISTIISVILIYNGATIHVVKLVGALFFVTRPIIMKCYVDRHYNIDYRVRYKHEPIKQKWNGIAQHLATQVQDSTDIAILTLFANLSDVSIYSVYNMIVKGVMQLIYTVNAGVSARIGRQIADADNVKLMKTFLSFEWAMHTASTMLFLVTGIMIIPFVAIYTQGVSDANYIIPPFAIMISICGALRCIQLTYNIVIQAAGHFRQTQFAAILEPFINICISLLMVRRFGLIGVTFGTIVSLTYRAIYLITYLRNNILKINIKLTIKQFLVDLLIVACVCILRCFFTIEPNGFYSWILYALVVFLVVSLISLVINYIFYKNRVEIILSKIFKGLKYDS